MQSFSFDISRFFFKYVGTVLFVLLLRIPNFKIGQLRFLSDPQEQRRNEPPRDQYAPVFISEELLNRTDFAIKLLKRFTGGWTVDDPAQAVFYIVSCLILR